MDGQKDILVAQALPVFLGTDGPRVLLGQKSCGEKVNDILIQPFGGKPDPGEKLEKAGKREFIEEFEFGTTLEMLRRLFSKKNFLGVFSASSDVDPERILRIHCWGARFSSPFQVREKLGSEMKNPHWYRFSEVFKNPKSGTLTKLMVAFFGCVHFFDADCIAYLRDIALDKEAPMGISNMALSALFEANRYKEKEYTLPVYADDRGLCTLLRHNSLLAGDVLPQAVTFKGATPVSVTY